MNALIQGTEEWKELRRSKVTASDACVIMGVSPWKTIDQLLAEKRFCIEEEESFIMRQGREREQTARQLFQELTGLIMFPVVIFHPEIEWMMASLDGMTLDGKEILEIKCPGKADHYKAQKGIIPHKYYPQIQHQLACTNLNRAYYFSFYQEEGIIIEVSRDELYISDLIDKEKAFYEKELFCDKLTQFVNLI